MRQKSRARNTSCDRPARRFRLHDPLTTRTSQLGTNLTDHFEAHGLDFQHLRNIFAEMFQLTAAVWASFLLWQIGADFPWQVRWQRPPYGSGHRLRVPDRFRQSSDLLRIIQLQRFEAQLQLFDLPVE